MATNVNIHQKKLIQLQVYRKNVAGTRLQYVTKNPTNSNDVSDANGKQFYHDISTMKKNHQKRWNASMLCRKY